jgi:hypothetical protein
VESSQVEAVPDMQVRAARIPQNPQISVPLAVGDLVDADPDQARQQVIGVAAVGATRVTIPATVRHAMRRNTVSTLIAVCAANQAQVSSNNQVCLAPGRAHGTCATTTPSSGHSTRGAAACRYAFVVPTSRVRHRRIPSPPS